MATEEPQIDSLQYKISNIKAWNEVAPRYHKKWVGPQIGPWGCTDAMLDLVDVQKGHSILDVACGTGAVISGLLKRVGSSGRIIGVDSSIKALSMAQGRTKLESNVDYIHGDVENVWFTQKFDITTCQFGLFFFYNAPEALKNIHRMTTDGGKLAVVVHGTLDEVPYHGCVIKAATRFIPDYFAPGAPSMDRYSDKKSLYRVVRDAGYKNITIQKITYRYSPGDYDAYWQGYITYISRLQRQKIESLGKRLGRFRSEVQKAAAPYTDSNGIIDFPWQVLILGAER